MAVVFIEHALGTSCDQSAEAHRRGQISDREQLQVMPFQKLQWLLPFRLFRNISRAEVCTAVPFTCMQWWCHAVLDAEQTVKLAILMLVLLV